MKRIKNFSGFIFESLTITPEIEQVLNDCVNGTWELVNGKVDVNGSFVGSRAKSFFQDGSILPLRFGKVTEAFDVSDLGIRSLDGSPDETERFNCSQNLLDSLESGPKKAKYYYCSNNYLNSLEGISENFQTLNASGNNIENLKALGSRDYVADDVILYNNLLLNSLEGCPKKVGKSLDVSNCNLKSLDGCSEEIGKNFNCESNDIRSLEGGPRIVLGFYDCSKNKLTDLVGCAEKPKWIDASNNNLSSVEGAPKNFGRPMLSLDNNFLPEEILRFQYDYLNSTDSNKLNWKEWLLFVLDENRDTKKWMLNFFNNHVYVGDKKAQILEIIKKSKLDEISHEEPGKLAGLATSLEKNSPVMDYILKNRDKFSSEFLNDLETSADLKDLGF